MSQSKTIADLPLDVNIRWAESQKILEGSSTGIADSSIVSQHAKAEVVSPCSIPNIDTLLGLRQKRQFWAVIEPPPKGSAQASHVFNHSGIISLLQSDKEQEALRSRIQGFDWESFKTKGEEVDIDSDILEKDRGSLLGLLKLLQSFNKDLMEIVSRCKQYQKG
jgi:hypothetical protein